MSVLSNIVSQFESSGNYSSNAAGNLIGVNSHASGAYQFQPGLWTVAANAAGYPQYAGMPAGAAPAAVQDAVFENTVANNVSGGIANWTCQGCSLQPGSAGANAVAQAGGLDALVAALVPAQAGIGVSTGAGGDTLTIAPPASSTAPGGAPFQFTDPSSESPSYQPFYIPGTSYPLTDPSGSGQFAPQAQAPQSAGYATGDVLPALGADIADFATRAALVLLAIALIAAAAWALARGETVRTVARVGRRELTTI